MFSLEIECDPDDRDMLIAELWEQGSAGIVELNPQRVRAFFEERADHEALLRLYPGSRMRLEEDRDWVQAARDLLQPMEVGKRFYLVPEWRDDPTPEGRFRIVVNPGLAFGTGLHGTTQLCVEALEDFVRPGMTVLDVGTGSGILGRAARLLGAGKVMACDIDEVALRIAAGQIEGNVFVGSVDAVAAGAADLVVANISPEAIVALAPEFARVLLPGGVLLASGFEQHEVEQVSAALPTVVDARHKGGWSLVVGRKPAA
jgi:ribosomal protein L11 methyltransferase